MVIPLQTSRCSLELTLAILKPHVVKAAHALQNIHNTIIEHRFVVVKSTKLILSKHQVERFYEEHSSKFFYNRLVSCMMSGESEVHILAKVNAIQEWRQLMGPTRVYQTIFSDPDSLRGKYGLTDTRNATHGSDSLESAAREVAVFFPSFDVVRWLKENEDNFHSGKLIPDISLIKSTINHHTFNSRAVVNA